MLIRIHRFIRRHASVCALLSIACGIVAAPYLIPENPDSAVFRSGTLGLILLLAAYTPLRQAYSRANLRTLLYGLGLGLLFSFALGLGSELFVYSGLLRGFGSMVRRMAVPVLAAPLIGGLFARAMLVRRPFDQPRTLHLPLWGYMLILLACWTPLLLANFPAAINYDFIPEHWQYLDGIYSKRHPLLYLMVNNGIIMLGGKIYSQTFGLFLSTLAHMIPFAAALAYALCFLQKRRVSAFALAALTASFSLHPIFSLMSISTSKDTVFTAALLVLSLLSFDMLENPEAFFSQKKRAVLFVLMSVFTFHMRKNGVFAFVLLFPLLLAALRGWRRQTAILLGASLFASLAVSMGMNLCLTTVEQPSTQLYSLPAQQLVRAYHSGKMTPEDMAELESFYTEPKYGLALYPNLADGAKGYLDIEKLNADPGAYLDLYLRVGKTCAHEYIEAALLLNIGSWYPDDLSHATVYQPSGLMVGYQETGRFTMYDYDINSYSFLPGIREFLERLVTQNRYQRYPLLPVLFCTAIPLWVMLFACTLFFARRHSRLAVSAAGMMGVWLSYQFGPCTIARYILPLFAFSPVLLLCAFCLPSKED